LIQYDTGNVYYIDVHICYAFFFSQIFMMTNIAGNHGKEPASMGGRRGRQINGGEIGISIDLILIFFYFSFVYLYDHFIFLSLFFHLFILFRFFVL